MKFKIFLLYSLLCISAELLAQKKLPENIQSGTEISLTEANKLNLKLKGIKPKLNASVVTLPIKVHIVRKSDGTGGIAANLIVQALIESNLHFASTNLQFNLCGNIDYINSSQLSEYDKDTDEAALARYNENDAINLYIVDAMIFTGYTYYPTGDSRYNMILLRKSAVGTGASLSHELGHYFGLYNTHEKMFGAENVARTGEFANCTSTGDLLCDTPADPKGTYNPISCTYTGTSSDVNDEPYAPQVNNIMSWYYSCRNTFTAEQINRINIGYTYRLQLMASSGQYSFNCAVATVNAPSNLAGSFNNNNNTLTWQDNSSNELAFAVERATSPTGTFSIIATLAANTTSYNDYFIVSNTSYYYRIRTLGNSTCSNTFNITSGTLPSPCVPSSTYGCADDDGLTSFIVNSTTLSLNSGCSTNGYHFFTDSYVNVTKGITNQISGTVIYYAQYVNIWIDYNQDAIFTVDEIVWSSGSSKVSNFSGSFVVPETVLNGLTRMRVRTKYNSNSVEPIDPCALVEYGETEDYLIFIKSASSSAYQTNTRVDSQIYWKKRIEEGVAPTNPYIVPPAAEFTSNLIQSAGLLTDTSPDIAIEDEGTNTQSELSIFAGPRSALEIFNSNNSYTPTPEQIGTSYFESDDFGNSWDGLEFHHPTGDSGDPAVCIGRDGKKYIGYIDANGGQGISSSTDGVTWTPVTIASINPNALNDLLDKNHLWIDNSFVSNYKNNLYSAWTAFISGNTTRNYQVEIAKSSDAGQTWSSPVVLSSALTQTFNHGVNLQTGPNGEVYAVWSVYNDTASDYDNTEDAIGFAKSTDGGTTFIPAVRIINNIRGIRDIGVGKNMRVNSFPSMAVDISDGANRGNIYVTWANIGTPTVNMGSDVDIYIIKSTNGGTTWSSPIKVNTSPAGQGKKNWFNWLTCDPITGTLSCIYYSDKNTTTAQAETWIANSFDGGNTWTNMRISDVKFTPTAIPGLATGYFGDYIGISAYNGIVYPVWTDNRSGRALAYTSPIAIGCIQNLVLQNGQTTHGVPNTYKAVNTIDVAGSGKTFKLENSSITTMQAGKSITLETGFLANHGSVFVAQIGACNNITFSTALPKNDLSNVDLQIKPINNFQYAIKTINNSSEIVVTDLLGNKLPNQSKKGKKLTVDFSKQPKGVYLIHYMQNNDTKVKKFILEK